LQRDGLFHFLGVHSYPENPAQDSQYDSESTVWLGRPEDCAGDGTVTASFPSSLYNTLRNQWGHRPKRTGEYFFGASQLFEHDAWGPDSMIGHCPVPTTPEGCNEIFNRTGAMQREAFALARLLGVKTCLGTESPLSGEQTSTHGKQTSTYLVDREVAGASEKTLYRSGRHLLRGYRLKMPDGRYRVTLMFCEPEHAAAGLRSFAVKLQDRVVSEPLTFSKRPGASRRSNAPSTMSLSATAGSM
jgi:hypothetical protein